MATITDDRRDLSQGSGWWEASDGRWYPPQSTLPPPPVRPKPGRRPLKWISLGIVAVIVVSIGAYFAVRPSTTSTTSGIPGTTATVSELNRAVQTQLVGTGAGNFGVHGVKTVTCNPPDRWNAGKNFECFVLNSSGRDIGYYEATVTPDDASGDATWVGAWIPVGG